MRQQRHERVQRRLPLLVADELSRPRRWLVERHLRRCDECRSEAERQRRVMTELAELREDTAGEHDPPPELLDHLLGQAAQPGLRARVAAPARGAVSGARPALSVTFGLLVLGLVAAAVWVGWRLADEILGED